MTLLRCHAISKYQFMNRLIAGLSKCDKNVKIKTIIYKLTLALLIKVVI